MKKTIFLLLLLFFSLFVGKVTAAQPLPLSGTFVVPDLFYQSESEYRSFFQELKDMGITLIILGGSGTGLLDKNCSSSTYDEQITIRLNAGAPPFLPIAIKLAKEFNMQAYFSLADYKFPHPCFEFSRGTRGDENSDKGRLIAFSMRTMDAIKLMVNKIGISWSDPTIAGFYITPEGDTNLISDINSPQFIFFKELADAIKQKEPTKKILLSPYQREETSYQNSLQAYKNLYSQTKIDIIAPQDSMGTGVTKTFSSSTNHYRALQDAVALSPGKEAWANIETFTQSSGSNSIVPGPIDRIKQQIETVQPYVSKTIQWIYQYTMLINPLSQNMAVKNQYASLFTPENALKRAILHEEYLSTYNGAQPTISITSAPRYATCDACGLCASSTCEIDFVPGDWARCVKCLYPDSFSANSTPDPTDCATLLIDEKTNLPATPVKLGRQYTLLGCITSGSGVGFETGAPSVVQVMLNGIFSLSGGIAFLYLMYGGFIILTSQADGEQLNYGKRLITGSIVGIIITLASVFFVNLIGSGILKIPRFSGVAGP